MGSSEPRREAFSHEAMATAFRIVIATDEPRYAAQAAAAAFAELDAIKGRLSRFAEGSDLFRINRLRRGEATLVHLDTFECLRIALEVQRDTGGAFDIAYASLPRVRIPPEGSKPSGGYSEDSSACPPGGAIREWPSGGVGNLREGARLEMDEAEHTVRVLADGVRLDLGGIGKGFALDRMAALLREWEVASALLCASTSTLLALAPPPGEKGWAVEFGPDPAPQRIDLANAALSASGLAVKGSHIIDPRTGRPAEGRFRAWALAPTGALADALSTAFMVMGEDEIRAYCSRHPESSAHCLASPSGALVGIGFRRV